MPALCRTVTADKKLSLKAKQTEFVSWSTFQTSTVSRRLNGILCIAATTMTQIPGILQDGWIAKLDGLLVAVLSFFLEGLVCLETVVRHHKRGSLWLHSQAVKQNLGVRSHQHPQPTEGHVQTNICGKKKLNPIICFNETTVEVLTPKKVEPGLRFAAVQHNPTRRWLSQSNTHKHAFLVDYVVTWTGYFYCFPE